MSNEVTPSVRISTTCTTTPTKAEVITKCLLYLCLSLFGCVSCGLLWPNRVRQNVYGTTRTTDDDDDEEEQSSDGLTETRFDSKLEEVERRLESKFDAKMDSKLEHLESKLDAKLVILESKFDAKYKSLGEELDRVISLLEKEDDQQKETNYRGLRRL